MKKIIKIIFLSLIVIFIIVQFIQPKKNISEDTSGAIFVHESLPENVKTILTNSCFDCHSNQTRYLWYDRIAPASWFVEDHIKDGKKEVNFSEWDKLSKLNKIRILDKIGKEVNDKDMPLKSYTALHRSARLSDEQIEVLIDWTEDFSFQLLNSTKTP